MDFTTYKVKLVLEAPYAVSFPPYGAANLIRGRLGRDLFHRDKALYERLFAPVRATLPSGFRNPPRPYVLRTASLDGQSFAEGAKLPFDLNLFDRSLLPHFADGETESNTIELNSLVEAERVRIDFLSPTEFKESDTPDFGVLFARLRDRISGLRAMYGAGPLEIDFKAAGERAKQVRMTHCETRLVSRTRDSRSSGLTHPIGGFVGHAIYEGALSEFTPYLVAGYDTGVGRQTVWGKGQIQTLVLR